MCKGLQNIGIWSAGPATDTLMNVSLGIGFDIVMPMSSPPLGVVSARWSWRFRET